MNLGSTTARVDGVVSLALLLAVANATHAQAQDKRVALDLSGGGSLTVTAEWSPIADSTYRIHEQKDNASIFMLEPAKAIQTYSDRDFGALLPKEPLALGDVWRLDQTALLNFMRQFHAGATTDLHHGTGAGGGYACLRAISSNYAEIVLRVNAEFVLAPGKAYYTPAQFSGRVLIDRERRHVVEFALELPDRNTNVDINVLPYADIVYVPRMRLRGGAAPAGVDWTEKIDLEEAQIRLAAKFYRFAAIHWVPFKDALEKARKEKKPVHVVVLFGTLDDESC